MSDDCREAFKLWHKENFGNNSESYAWSTRLNAWQAAWNRRAPSRWRPIAEYSLEMGSVWVSGWKYNDENRGRFVCYARMEENGWHSSEGEALYPPTNFMESPAPPKEG